MTTKTFQFLIAKMHFGIYRQFKSKRNIASFTRINRATDPNGWAGCQTQGKFIAYGYQLDRRDVGKAVSDGTIVIFFGSRRRYEQSRPEAMLKASVWLAFFLFFLLLFRTQIIIRQLLGMVSTPESRIGICI